MRESILMKLQNLKKLVIDLIANNINWNWKMTPGSKFEQLISYTIEMLNNLNRLVNKAGQSKQTKSFCSSKNDETADRVNLSNYNGQLEMLFKSLEAIYSLEQCDYIPRTERITTYIDLPELET